MEDKDEKKLVMKITPEVRSLLEAFDRRHNGAVRSQEDIEKATLLMNYLYSRWKQYKEKEDHLRNVEWEEKEIEKYFMSNLWKNAHKRLNRYETIVKECWKRMFYLLTRLDGNPGQVFIPFEVIDPEEIYAEFKDKYMFKWGLGI